MRRNRQTGCVYTSIPNTVRALNRWWWNFLGPVHQCLNGKRCYGAAAATILIGLVKVDRIQTTDDHALLSLLATEQSDNHRLQPVRYDTIRDAILTCARKPTWVSLINRTEPTTKKCKNRKKTKSRKQICPEITVNSPGNPCSKYLSRKKGRATVEKICREGRF